MTARTLVGEARYKATMEKKKALRAAKQQHSTLAAITPTVIYNEYWCVKDQQMKLFTDKTAERWAKEIIEWARKPDSYRLMDWFIENDIHHADGMKICEIYPCLKKAYSQAKLIIASRREKGGLKNELNAGMIHSSMAMYCPEWKSKAEWEAGLKKDMVKAGNVHVTIERYPSSDLVPEKEIMKITGEQDADI